MTAAEVVEKLPKSRSEYIQVCREFVQSYIIQMAGRVRWVYILNTKCQRVGAAVVTLDTQDDIHVGVSKCHPRDRFDRYIALRKAIAKQRMLQPGWVDTSDKAGTLVRLEREGILHRRFETWGPTVDLLLHVVKGLEKQKQEEKP